MRSKFFTLLTFLFAAGIITTAFSQGTQDERIWSRIFIDQNSINPTDPNYKWDPPAPQTKIFLFGGSGVTVNPNFRPNPTTNTTQSELSVDVAPFDENIVFASANTTNWPVSTLFGTGVYWTFDGAQSWAGGDIPPFGSNSGDPASVIGANGYFYEGYISNSGGMGVSVSTNNGTSWTSYNVNSGSDDKNHLMVDKLVGSPYENRVYNVWTAFSGANSNDIVIKYSTNFGQNWSAAINLSSSLNAGSHNQGVNVQTGPNGEVYVTWAVYDNWPGGEDAIGFASSTDGGVTWSSARVYGALTPNGSFNFGIRGSLKPTSIRVSSFPSMAVNRTTGDIYITWVQRGVTPAGSDPDIVMIKSTDGGATWSAPVRVNDDALNNGKDQYFPWMTVDQTTGQLLFVFYDSRNINNDSSSVWMASSFDAGTTFNNFEVSEQPFKPKPIPGLAGGYQGDYIGIAALNDVAYPYWADDRTGNYQGWMSVVNFGPPCPIDPPTNPAPVNGATDVPITLAELSWDNGVGATENELWFGEAGSMVLVHSGSLINSWAISGSLPFSTSYQWRVVEWNDTCNVSGPVWSFVTEPNPDIVIDNLFLDDFESGLGLWSIVNNGGTCDWQIYTEPYPNSYTLPPTSSGGVLSADSDDCGSGTTMNTTATIIGSFDFTIYTEMVWIEFDNDWRTIGADDDAIVEISTDGGGTWFSVWERLGVSERNTHEVVDITTQAAGLPDVQFRLVSVQPGWDWWWTLDNFSIYGMLIIPVELTSFAAVTIDDNVQLNWTTATEINNQGFEIQRKTDDGEFEKVGFVAGHGTTTDIQNYSYVDSKVVSGSYNYRLKQIDFNGTFEYSDAVEVEVTVPLEFTLEQNYPNPFNPSTSIKYSIPENGFVTLDVFNLLGEKVASLVNGVQEAGRYEVNFSAIGGSASGGDAGNLASGIYVYSLKSGSFNSVKKMLLMK